MGIAIIVVVIVLAFLLSEAIAPWNTHPGFQRFNASCTVSGGNGTGVNTTCDYNVTLSSGSVAFNWTVRGGNATSVILTVNDTANATTRSVDRADATRSGGLTLTVCNASLPHSAPCQAPPGAFNFEFRTGTGVNGWANYKIGGYFQAKSQG